MKIFIISPFPETINILIENNIANQGIKKNLLNVNIINLRNFAKDNYKKIDDEPYGGGSGMVMMCQPLFDAIDHCIALCDGRPQIIFPSPRGEKFCQLFRTGPSALRSSTNKRSIFWIFCGSF